MLTKEEGYYGGKLELLSTVREARLLNDMSFKRSPYLPRVANQRDHLHILILQ